MRKEQREHSPSYSAKLYKLQENFQQICLSSGQPLIYCELFIQSLSNKHYENKEEEYKFKMYSFADEINRIKKGDSFCQEMQIIMNQREQNIKLLRSQLINSRISKQLNLSTACERLQSIRMYNLMVIQKLIRLRSQFKITQAAYFTQILQKISQDADFLRLSPLRNHIPFSNSKDPLFIIPLKKFWNQQPTDQMQRRPIIDLFNLDAEYQKRLEKADIFLKKMQAKEYNDIPLSDGTEQDIGNDEQQNYTQKQREIRLKTKNIDEISKSTLQKFILPSVNIQNRMTSDNKRRNYVSNIIKDVISDYEERDKMQTQNPSFLVSPNCKKKGLYKSNEKSKRMELQRSIPRECRPQQIKYRVDKAHSLLSKQKLQQKRIFKNQKLPELSRPIKKANLNYNQYAHSYQDEYEDVVENKAHTVDIIDPEIRKIRRNSGRIIKNYNIKTQPNQYLPQPLKHFSRKVDSPYKLMDNDLQHYQQQQSSSPGTRQSTIKNIIGSMPKKIYFNSYESEPVERSQRSDEPKEYRNLTKPRDQSDYPNYEVIYQNLQNARKVQKLNKLEKGREEDRRREQDNKRRQYNIIKQYDYTQSNIKNGDQNSKIQSQSTSERKESSVKKYQIINQFDIKSLAISPKNTKREVKPMQSLNRVLQVTLLPKYTNPISQSSPIANNQNLRYANSVQKLGPFKQGKTNNRNLASSQGSSVASPKFPSNNSNSLSLTSNIDPTVTFNNSASKNEYPTTMEVNQPPFSTRNQQRTSNTAQISAFEVKDRKLNESYININSIRDVSSTVQVSQSGSSNLNREKIASSSVNSKIQPTYLENKVSINNNTALNNIDPISLHSSSNNMNQSNKVLVNQNVSNSSINSSNQMMPASQSSNFKSQIHQGSQNQALLNSNNSFSPRPEERLLNSNNSISNSRARQIQKVTVNLESQPKKISSSLLGSKSGADVALKNSNQFQRYPEDFDSYKQSIHKSNSIQPSNLTVKTNNDPILQGQSKVEFKKAQIIQIRQPKPLSPNKLYKEDDSQSNSPNKISSPFKQSSFVENNSVQPNIIAAHRQNPVEDTTKTERKQAMIANQPGDLTKSKISIPNPQISSNMAVSTNAVQSQQISITKQQAATLQKCIFQSKSIVEQELLKQIKILSSNKYDALLAYLTASFFTNRHINLTNCVYNNQIACFCIYFPQITLNRRLLYILHIEVAQEKMMSMEPQLISTFIKYIFVNDPCEKIIYLRHANLMSESHKNSCQSLKNYAGQIKNPVKMAFLNENALCFQRKGIVCKQVQKYTSVLNTFGLFVCPATNKPQFHPAKIKNFNIEPSFLKKMEAQLTSRQAQQFKGKSELTSYLQEQGLPLFKSNALADNLMFTSFIFEDCLLRSRFLAHANEFFFTVEPPYSYLLQNKNTYFVLISTSESKKFYIFGDKLYEQAEEIDLLKQFRQKVMNKPFSSVFKGENGKGKVISCPQFKKQIQVEICPQVYTNFTVELNWKQYIKGVRYLKQDNIYLQLIAPFFCGMVEIDDNTNVQLLYSCYIMENQIPK